MRIDGHLAFRVADPGYVHRRGHKSLTKRACRYWLLGEGWSLLIDWVPYEGVWPWRLHRGAPDGPVMIERDRPQRELSMKRKVALGLVGVPIPSLPMESTVLKKYPRVLEHLVATAYEDGASRAPGSIRFDNKLISLLMTLYDPDSGMRLPVNGQTVDDCLAFAEKLLAAPDCPWEVDRYLTEQLQKKQKEKDRQVKRKK